MNAVDEAPVPPATARPSGEHRTTARNSLVDLAYREIRHAITSGRVSAGQKLVVRVLSEWFDLSPTPIKSALVTLQGEGYITAVPRRGYFVADISDADMSEIYELRALLEGRAAEKAAGGAGRADLVAELERLLAEQRRFVAAGQVDAYADSNVDFHRLIWAAAGNDRLTAIVDNLAGQIRIGTGTSSRARGRLRAALTEHAEIIDAIRRGDRRAAGRTARRHVAMTRAAFEQRSRERIGNSSRPTRSAR